MQKQTNKPEGTPLFPSSSQGSKIVRFIVNTRAVIGVALTEPQFHNPAESGSQRSTKTGIKLEVSHCSTLLWRYSSRILT